MKTKEENFKETLKILTKKVKEFKELAYSEPDNMTYRLVSETFNDFAVDFAKNGFGCASAYYLQMLSLVENDLPEDWKTTLEIFCNTYKISEYLSQMEDIRVDVENAMRDIHGSTRLVRDCVEDYESTLWFK